MSVEGLRHQDNILIPNTPFAFNAGSNQQLLSVANVGDWTTLHLHAKPRLSSTALGAELTSAIRIIVKFYQIPGPSNNSLPTSQGSRISGRDLCVGACRLINLIVPSSLDVRLPIVAPYMDITVDVDASQTNVVGANITVWTSNEPSYSYTTPVPVATSFIGGWTCGDSLLGNDYGGALGQPTRGLILGSAQSTIIELLAQEIGTGWFCWEAEATSGNVLANGELAVAIVNKTSDDTTNVIDQTLFRSNNTFGSIGGVPLTGYRQGVYMLNFTAAPNARNIAFHWAIYPEAR